MRQTPITCPSCHTSLESERPRTDCPSCGAEYPSHTTDGPTWTRAWLPTQKPLLLWLAQFIGAGLGLSYLILLGRAGFDLGSFGINGQTVLGHDVFAFPATYFIAL